MVSVKVHVYDLSQGLAKALSYQLLGQHLDGVWHTGIVVYGKEYFYGSDGINMCPPCGTILGNPQSVVDLGTTEIPEDLFTSYLTELSQEAFRPEKYHLFDHNCNNFSDEAAYFLTNNHIPSHITSLPREVSNTPLGQMLRTFVDQMSGGVSSIFLNPPSTSSAAPSVSKEATTVSGASAEVKTNNSASKPKQEVELCEGDMSQASLEHWRAISTSATSTQKDVFNFATSSDLNWGLGPKHFSLIGKQLLEDSSANQLLTLELFRVALLRSSDVAIGLMNDRHHHWQQLLDQLAEKQYDGSPEFYGAFTKVACNFVGQTARAGLQLTESCREALFKFVLKDLGGSDSQVYLTTHLAYNMTCLQAPEDDSLLALGSILIHIISGGDAVQPETAYEYAVKTLLNLFQFSDDLRQLAVVQGLDVSSVKIPAAIELQKLLELD